MSEKELSEGCKAQKKEAYKELYYSYAQFLYFLILRYVINEEVAKDLLHDLFLELYKKISLYHYQGEGSLKAWLARIAVNHALMWLREKNKVTIYSLDEEREQELSSSYEEPEDETLWQIPMEQLQQFIDALPIGYRTVFLLYVMEHRSHREIAQQLGINERSSSSQLARARKMLAQKIVQWQRQNAQ